MASGVSRAQCSTISAKLTSESGLTPPMRRSVRRIVVDLGNSRGACREGALLFCLARERRSAAKNNGPRAAGQWGGQPRHSYHSCRGVVRPAFASVFPLFLRGWRGRAFRPRRDSFVVAVCGPSWGAPPRSVTWIAEGPWSWAFTPDRLARALRTEAQAHTRSTSRNAPARAQIPGASWPLSRSPQAPLSSPSPGGLETPLIREETRA